MDNILQLVDVFDAINDLLVKMHSTALDSAHMYAERQHVVLAIRDEVASFEGSFHYSPELPPAVAHALSFDL